MGPSTAETPDIYILVKLRFYFLLASSDYELFTTHHKGKH